MPVLSRYLYVGELGHVGQVHAGEELRALREYFTTTQRKGGVMLPFYVEYTIGDEGFDVNESGTVDCGGPTKRMLSSAWFQYWDNVGVSSTWQLLAFTLRMNLHFITIFKCIYSTGNISIELLIAFELHELLILHECTCLP